MELLGKNGLKLAEELRAHGMDYDIVFISGKEDYVWQAFDVSALQFLRKPVSQAELKKVIDRAVERINSRNQEDKDSRASMVVRYKGITEKVYLSDIVYAEASGRKVILHRMNDDLEYYGKISDLEKMFGSDFYRVHRAYLATAPNRTIQPLYMRKVAKHRMSISRKNPQRPTQPLLIS